MTTQIVKVEGKSQLAKFIDFPHELYKGDPNYVPMIYMEQEALLNPKKSPFYKHSKADHFLALQGDKVVGRISAIRNNNHIQFSGKQEGYFGFFDVINDYDVAKMLLDAAVNWLKSEGLNKVIGPTNFSTNETVGVLIETFDEPPSIMTTYNFPYYAEFLDKYGFGKMTDLLSWKVFTNNLPQDVMEFSDKLEKRLNDRGITIRNLNMKKYAEEIERIFPIYNQSWAENTGFVPMSDAEVRQLGSDLKMIVDPTFVYLVEKEDKVIGIGITIPNVNEIQINVKKGRLFPFGAIKILTGLKKIKSVRILALGTLKEYRRMGIDVVLYVRNMKAALARGMDYGEASWILENNDAMNRALEHINGKVFRKHRLYEKEI